MNEHLGAWRATPGRLRGYGSDCQWIVQSRASWDEPSKGHQRQGEGTGSGPSVVGDDEKASEEAMEVDDNREIKDYVAPMTVSRPEAGFQCQAFISQIPRNLVVQEVAVKP
ncbi:hypothetical protein DPEC_G00047690 [Dallia pectoralis]|uniref:Uncharacterized protein n=1 Tax=Dallia pectoralis TaxID=75939 RepID=A0ACC2HAH8_DALPE|nr:hypothetical protein DPEC_G00047690 [Dallia pectoralis]